MGPGPLMAGLHKAKLERNGTSGSWPTRTPKECLARHRGMAPLAPDHERLGSAGQPLDANLRSFMEPRFGYDFSRVRVHADGKAGESARELGARGYTIGHDIVFAPSDYPPRGTLGMRLLAHEPTHVIQQRGQAGAPHTVDVSAPADASEREAADVE